MTARDRTVGEIPRFDRRFLDGAHRFARIGDGALGGKASGLVFIDGVLSGIGATAASLDVAVPRFAVVATDSFDAFLERNDLRRAVASAESDQAIVRAFLKADLPVGLVGDLRALIEHVHTPLAIRSSSLLEDSLDEPFAGVYATKMIPNNAYDPDLRWRKLAEAVKFVWASTFFTEAAAYIRATGRSPHEEKMAVIVQEVVGRGHRDRFYPDLSGVARSFNFYPTGHARPEQGVAHLALGLGKTIVDGGTSWPYSPAWPKSRPPFSSVPEALRQTQTEFWAVHMGTPAYDPLAETEYLVRCSLADAESDEALKWAASTYDAASDRLLPGVATTGPRLLDFAPLLSLNEFGFNAVLKRLLALSEEALGERVEIEFAATFPERPGEPARFGFLQVRPMAVSHETVEVPDGALDGPDTLVASRRTMGNGALDALRDVVYVKPEAFDPAHTPAIAAELERVNRALVEAGRPYVLIGFGRWGSTDPWLGIPVVWSQISGARVIVESGLPNMRVDPSQGSHFFHNITSFQIPYFTVRQDVDRPVAWDRLAALPSRASGPFVRHVETDSPLAVRVDGRTGRGAILLAPTPGEPT
jgi:hypothetical protein